jgi:hypothetical protein
MATNSPGSIDNDMSCRICRVPTRLLTSTASTRAPRVLNRSIVLGLKVNSAMIRDLPYF